MQYKLVPNNEFRGIVPTFEKICQKMGFLVIQSNPNIQESPYFMKNFPMLIAMLTCSNMSQLIQVSFFLAKGRTFFSFRGFSN